MSGYCMPGAGDLAIEAETTALIARMSTAPNLMQKRRMNAFIRGCKNAGLWSKFDAVGFTAVQDSTSALLNWKSSSFNLTKYDTPTFIAGQGFTGNGSAAYFSTNFTPSTAPSPNFVRDSAACGAFTFKPNNVSNLCLVGTNSSAYGPRLKAASGHSSYYDPSGYLNNGTPLTGTSNLNLSEAIAPSLFSISRTDANTVDVYRGGTSAGTAASSASTGVSTQVIWLLRSGTNYSNENLAFWFISSKLASADVAALWKLVRAYLQSSARPIGCWGDSLTWGSTTGGVQTANNYPAVMQTALGRPVYNGGWSGATSTQILTVANADDFSGYGTLVIWAGRNNYADATTVKSDIASMVAKSVTKKFLILSILNGNYATEYVGQTGYNQIIQLNSDLASLYPNNFVDVRTPLVAAYNPGIPQDVTDHGNDIPPSSLRVDNLHLTDPGYAIVEGLVANALTARGW